MRWPKIAARTIIGVDIGSRYVKAAQVVGQRISAVWFPRASSEGPVEAFEIRHLAEALQEGGLRGKSLVLAAPRKELLAGIMELPPRASGAPIDQLARSELARRHNADMNALEMACWDLPSPARAANRTYVMAVACPQASADNLLDTVEAEGLSAEAMDVHARAISRACMPLLSDVDQTAAILDVGWTSSRLVLLYCGTVVYERDLARSGVIALTRLAAPQRDGDTEEAERVLFTRGIEEPAPAGKTPGPAQAQPAGTPTHSVASPLAAQLGNMAGEVRTSLAYLVGQYPDSPVSRLLLVGGGACIPGLQQLLAEKLQLDVRVVNPSDLGQCSGQAGGAYGPSLISAIGLAQYSGRAER